MYKRLAIPLVATLATLWAASSAMAGPTGEFAVFGQCPYENENVESCVYSTTSSGEVVLGNKTVPITKTITLQGGTEEVSGETHIVAASNGETLSKTPENVPGGLSGLVNCQEITGSGFWEGILRGGCESVFEKGITGVTATTELAVPATSVMLSPGALVNETGTALKLPVKVHLENTLLGSECYVGSSSKPLELELTTGTTSPPAPNNPIKGSSGTISFTEGDILVVEEYALVNNSFSAPEASGCGGIVSFLLDPIIDAEIGLPSAAGHNTAILEGTLENASRKAVKRNAEES